MYMRVQGNMEHGSAGILFIFLYFYIFIYKKLYLSAGKKQQ